ncbi:hypothetical protein [Variovorax ginsengisoli]|uniref:Leucine-rich repeat domain-containing protein n=1 Tax=Variovorax ginsengisoli TaxID=363844 RepID=A0ABT9S5Z6_9BURK|nr:hypothetical protein [Variovorax ginsengisoli]MDP9899781.1 hypothetical protein [Variovorax ginsengisoli]
MTIASLPDALRLLPHRLHDLALLTAAERNDGAPEDPLTVPLYESDFTRLALAPMRQGWHVEYFGETWGEAFEETLACLSRQDVADGITSLSFSGVDSGANGTRDWTFAPLLDSPVTFPRLRSLFIKPTQPEDHNQSVVCASGRILEEGGDIARWVRKTPHLSELTVPNAPDADFFAVPLPQLTCLCIGAHFDTQRFIGNLAKAAQLPGLKLLDFSESTEQQMAWPADRAPDGITAFEDYEALLQSPMGAQLRVLRLRNTCLDLAQLQHLQGLRPALQFMVIQSTIGGYVSHFAQDVFPWRHLVPADPGLAPYRK